MKLIEFIKDRGIFIKMTLVFIVIGLGRILFLYL